MCQRSVRLSRTFLIGGSIAAVLLLFFLLAGSSRFRSTVQNWRMSPEVVRNATQQLVVKNPAIHAPVTFSGPDQTMVEHWDAYRWRVSGYVESKAQDGAKVRTLYFAVVQNSGNDWRLEDLQLQNVEAR